MIVYIDDSIKSTRRTECNSKAVRYKINIPKFMLLIGNNELLENKNIPSFPMEIKKDKIVKHDI